MSGSYLTRNIALCGASDPKSYVYFHRQTPILIAGSVQPKPSPGWHVTITVKHCVGKTFRTLKHVNITGRSNGTFSTAYRPGLAGVYWLQTHYDTSNKHAKSAKRLLVVR